MIIQGVSFGFLNQAPWQHLRSTETLRRLSQMALLFICGITDQS